MGYMNREALEMTNKDKVTFYSRTKRLWTKGEEVAIFSMWWTFW